MRGYNGRTLLLLFLLWLAGGCLRFTVLSVPPLLPRIHSALRLDEVLVGALTALPVLLLAAGAVFGSLLVARLGARRALLIGLLIVAAGGAVRGVGPATGVLFGATFAMGLGVAISQPTLASLVRVWLPRRVGVGTAVYANGLLVGEILPAALTLPLVLPLLGGWERSLAFWSIPVLGTVALIALFTPHVPRPEHADAAGWIPSLNDGRAWRLGLMMGSAGLAYFGANAFIPDYLKATGHPGMIGAALTSLNLGQYPSSVLLLLAPNVFIARRWPILCCGAAGLIATAGFAMGGSWIIVGAGVLGFSTALVFILGLAIPPLVAEEHELHRLISGVFTVGYVCPFSGSILGGAIWDLTGRPLSAFLPVAVGAVLMGVMVLGVDLSHARREHLGLGEPEDLVPM